MGEGGVKKKLQSCLWMVHNSGAPLIIYLLQHDSQKFIFYHKVHLLISMFDRKEFGKFSFKKMIYLMHCPLAKDRP